jgi:hypothetical protein
MTSVKYIGLDVHKESISICVRNSVGKVVMESVIETKASMIVQFIEGLRGDCQSPANPNFLPQRSATLLGLPLGSCEFL